MKTVNGAPYYDRDKFKMELAEDMNVGDMSVTFKLKKNATFHDGTPVTAKDVKWSLDRAVTVGGFPTFQMGAGSLDQARAVRRGRRPHRARRFPAQGPPDHPRSRGDRAGDLQLRAGQEERHRKGPVGPRIHQAEHRRQRRLPRGELERRHRSHPRAQRQVDRRPAAEGASASIWRMVPSAGNRRALLERGDADISYDLPNKDFVELQETPASSTSSRRRTRTASSTSA